jgi:hypothetical protein
MLKTGALREFASSTYNTYCGQGVLDAEVRPALSPRSVVSRIEQTLADITRTKPEYGENLQVSPRIAPRAFATAAPALYTIIPTGP